MNRHLVALALAVAAVAGAEPALQHGDEVVIAGMVKATGGEGAEWPAGYGLVLSLGPVVAVPAKLLGTQGEVVLHLGGERYVAKAIKQDPRGVALVQCVAEGLHTVPLASADALMVGAGLRVLKPAGDGWQAVPASLTRNDVKRLGRVKVRYLELDLAVADIPPGAPVYLPETGQVVGMIGPLGKPDETPTCQALTADVLSSLLLDAGVELRSNVLTETGGVVDAEGRLARSALSAWRFETNVGQPSAAGRRALQFWQAVFGRFPDPLTQAVIDGGLMYFGESWNGRVYAVRLDEQRRSWTWTDPSLMLFYPPTVAVDVVCAPVGTIWTAATYRFEELLTQHEMWQGQDRAGPPLATIAADSRRPYGGSNPTIEQRALHFALYGAGALCGVDRQTGRERWRVPVGFVGRPTVVGNRVYFAGLGIRGCLDAGTGTLLWAFGDHYDNREPTRNTWWHLAYSSTGKLYYLAVPVWYGHEKDLRLHGSGECYLVEADPATGAKRAEHNLFTLSYDDRNAERPLATFAVIDGEGTPRESLYCLVGQNIFRVNTSTGEFTALRQVSGNAPQRAFSTELAVADGVLYVGTSNRELLALDGATGNPVWAETPVLKGAVGSPVVAGGRVYVGTSDGYLHAFAAADGRRLWWYEVGGRIVGQPIVLREGDKEILYCALDSGRVMALDVPQL